MFLTFKELVFLFFGILSVASFLLGVFFSVKKRDKFKEKTGLESWQTVAGTAFVSGFLMHLPVYYWGLNSGTNINPLFPFVKSAIQTIKMFLLDSELDTVIASLSNVRLAISLLFSCWAIVLFIACPIFTAKLLLVIFKDFVSQLRVKSAKNKKIYIMSELNDMSVALAESIKNTFDAKSMIVFLNVTKTEEAAQLDLIQKAAEMKAVCLKQGLTDTNIFSKSKLYEVFIISENETENIEKTIAFTEKYRSKLKAKIFVYASSTTSGYIIDSLDKDRIKVENEALKSKINSGGWLFDYIYENGTDNLIAENDFDIRRIDYSEDFAVKALKESNVFAVCKAQDKKVISVLIVGLGKFGKEILKVALWFFQVPGYQLEINVIDYGMDKRGLKTNVLEAFEHECPEILAKNKPEYSGEEGYDIRFFEADCFSNSLDRLFKTEKERLSRTQVVFVTLGGDDKNVDAAIEIRRQFDRVLGLSDSKKREIKASSYNDIPFINAVVFDDRKAKNIENELKNHKNVPYHINSIGSLREVYNYNNITEIEKTERNAVRYHIEWIYVEKRIREALKTCSDENVIRKICECRGVKSVDEIVWYDNIENPVERFKEEMHNYYQYEYFRNSSISKAIHKEMLHKEFAEEIRCKNGGESFLCMCSSCMTRRKIEHMRWSAFMRVNGFRYGSERWDRGKIHPDLVETEKLDFETQFKD